MPGGRPTDYHAGRGQEMIDFFMSWPEYIEETKEVASGGRKVVIKEMKPNVPPTFIKFGKKIGVTRSTLKLWADTHPEFSAIYEACKEIYEEFMSDKGLRGEFNAGFCKLLLVNHTSIRETVVQEIKSVRLEFTPKD